MLKWQATLHTQENSEGLHDIHWRFELLSQGGAGSIHCLDVEKKSVIDCSARRSRANVVPALPRQIRMSESSTVMSSQAGKL